MTNINYVGFGIMLGSLLWMLILAMLKMYSYSIIGIPIVILASFLYDWNRKK